MDIDIDYAVENLRYVPGSGKLYWKKPGKGRRAGVAVGVMGGSGYLVMANPAGGQCAVHRVCFALLHGYYPEMVDHINGDRTDNTETNLRAATARQNRQNSKMPINNSTGYKWVRKDGDRYMAVVKWGSSSYTQRGFDCPEAAHIVAAAKHRELAGEFHRD